MTTRKVSALLLCLLLATPAWSKVLLRWNQSALPPARNLGVTDLVVSWNSYTASFLETARKQGYKVYVQGAPEQVAQIAEADKSKLAGAIVEVSASQLGQADDILRKLRSANPNLALLLLDPNGKQPQMKGTMVIKKDGVLEVTSPTAQPWIDSNVPLVRFEQGFRPSQVPLYTFQWELAGPLEQKQGPSAADYSLAIVEAGALHADLILNLSDELQKGLAANAAAALTMWKQLGPALEFSAQSSQNAVPEANIGVVTDNYDTAYEPMNLMARHNIPFRVLPVSKLDARDLAVLRMLLIFAAPSPQAIGDIASFAAGGGTAILVGLQGFYPWHTAAATRTARHSVAYTVGKGRIIELSEPVIDPETFAQDVRRLMKDNEVVISLWNALTTIGVFYRNPSGGKPEAAASVLELVNYSGDPLRVQARIKGSFHSIRYESPEHACCLPLTPTHHDGFTEFVIPSLTTAGRVLLGKASHHN